MIACSRKWFGTDGIRGPVGKPPITPDFFKALGYSVAKMLASVPSPRVLLGRDPRESSEVLQQALLEGLASGKVRCDSAEILPTPGIAYLTRYASYDLGIVISASHNLYTDNGVKFFDRQGFKLNDAAERQIEAGLNEQVPISPKRVELAHVLTEAACSYGKFCLAAIDIPLDLAGIKIVVDCANGAMSEIAPWVLAQSGAQIFSMANTPNGRNINWQCGATDLQALCQQVLANQAHLGIAFDGDGDRLLMVDHLGEVVDGDEILFILLRYFLQQGTWQGGVVGTHMTNMGVVAACQELGVEFVRSAVGDRYVLEALQQRGWWLGGESSGHIVCLHRTTTGDGLLAALQVLAALHTTGQSLHALKQGVTKYPQILLNIPVPRFGLEKDEAIQQALVQAQRQLGGRGRILLRSSGTEPLLRLMVEGKEQSQVTTLAHSLAASITQLTACKKELV